MSKKGKGLMTAAGHDGGAASDVSDFLAKHGWKVMAFRGGKVNKDSRH
ncbi:MAG: hypothetical protein FWF35_04870 [Elusimicrobia bacterium]|nr:hypothetical protein [Elusimicrobiota bacterium]